jgi:CRP-like cAMP-binding protein
MSTSNYFFDVGVRVTIVKGTCLFHQHHEPANLFFIEQGLVKAFYETRDGKEFIKSFIREGQIIGSLQALFADRPNSFSVVALEDCVVLEIPKAHLLGVAGENREFQTLMNEQLLALAMKKEQREYELLCLSAEERYQLFCEREADLVPRLAQVDIARYLGITPVALSRIRKRLRG